MPALSTSPAKGDLRNSVPGKEKIEGGKQTRQGESLQKDGRKKRDNSCLT